MDGTLKQCLTRLAVEQEFLPFYTFQQQALYHPIFGYYTRTRSPFGRTGDFYTAPEVHPVFGQSLAKFIYDHWCAERLEHFPQRVELVEFGAGDGRLADAVLSAFRRQWPALYEQVHYTIVEISPRSIREQQERLGRHPHVNWLPRLPQLSHAFIFSNEFVDALPVHLVEKTGNGSWLELGVSWNGDRFVLQRRPLVDAELVDYANRYGRELPVHHWIEINLDVLNWMRSIAGIVQHGRLLTFDYGAEISELYPDYQPTGTIRGYLNHQVVSDILADPGEMDLTHDVNFTALMDQGTELGWDTLQFTGQSQFLVSAGLLETLTKNPEFDAGLARAIKHLLLGFSPKFQVLLQGW